MENGFTNETSRPAKSVRVVVRSSDEVGLTPLTEVELLAVAGGINPQPLPPRRESRFSWTCPGVGSARLRCLMMPLFDVAPCGRQLDEGRRPLPIGSCRAGETAIVWGGALIPRLICLKFCEQPNRSPNT